MECADGAQKPVAFQQSGQLACRKQASLVHGARLRHKTLQRRPDRSVEMLNLLKMHECVNWGSTVQSPRNAKQQNLRPRNNKQHNDYKNPNCCTSHGLPKKVPQENRVLMTTAVSIPTHILQECIFVCHLHNGNRIPYINSVSFDSHACQFMTQIYILDPAATK